MRYRIMKCSDPKTGSPLASWCSSVLIVFLYGLPHVRSSCMGVNVTVATYPQGAIVVPYGNPLEIFCIAESYTADDLEFSMGGKYLGSAKINETTRRLYIKNPVKQTNSYYCRNKKTAKLCVSRVLVESPPANVTDFSCISRNLEVLKCSWTTPETYTLVIYSITFEINGKSVGPPCVGKKIILSDVQRSYCRWDTTSHPRYRQYEAVQYFRLKSCNVFGCNYQNFTIDHYSIVKPDPPIDLIVVKNDTRSVVLKWTIPNNIVDLLTCGVEHIIEYQIAKIDNTTYFHQVDTSMLPSKNKTYKFQLSNLPYPHMQYEVRIYIKSKKAVKREYWSDFSYTVFYTASERPQRPPDMIAGAFALSNFAVKRSLYIYWKQLEECEEAGANFTYKVLLTQGHKTFPVIYPDKNKSLGYVIVNEVSLEAIDVTVWSVNANGSSLNSSYMYIPAKKDIQSLGLTSFTKVAYENGTYELSWVGIKNIDNYTLFWCHHNATQICSGRIDFTVLDARKNNHVIDLPREYRYQFAISANNGTKTSGMVWAKCDISKDGFVMYGFPVELKYDPPSNSSVLLRWRMDCALQNGIITGYNISYCPIVQTNSSCDQTVGNKYKYVSDPKQMDVLIENLLSFRTYQFSLTVNTIYGKKAVENAVIMVTTSEGKPTAPIKVGVNDVKSNSLVISWEPPLQINGIIIKYIVYNYDKIIYEDKVAGTVIPGDMSRRQVTLTELTPFTNYSLAVKACNTMIDLCSDAAPNPGILVRTKIGAPSALKAPTILKGTDRVKWEPPIIPGGAVDLYQIRRVREEILNTSELSYSVARCEGVLLTELYQVRAVNFDKDINYGVIGVGNVTVPIRFKNNTCDEYPGEWSPPSAVISCT